MDMSDRIPNKYRSLDYSRIPFCQRVLRAIFGSLLRLVIRLEVRGIENVPLSGGVVLAGNHVNFWLDVPLYYSLVPRRSIGFAAARWKSVPIIGWILDQLTDAIYVRRGQPDAEALGQALTVLRAGGALAIAPEGTVSNDGRLLRGRPGFVYLATMAPAPIVPVASYGQEKTWYFLKRLRRVPVTVIWGAKIELPQGRLGRRGLREHTDRVMTEMAAMLPIDNRGVYGDRVREKDTGDQKGGRVTL
jgi:1-acyl-sn-glycerol-3-phosphate acyltransferase